MGTFLQDLRFAFRNLRRTPAFPIAAIATLALGVGATTAIFSTVNAALLRPLPYPNANDLYSMRTTLTDGRLTTGFLAPNEVLRLNLGGAPSLVKAVGLQPFDLTLMKDDATPIKTRVFGVSEGFFEMFGLPMTLGGFMPQHFVQQNGPPPGVVISTRIWQNMFNSDPQMVGKPIRFAELSTTCLGIANPAFDTPHNADFWAPISLPPDAVGHNLEGFMRVKPGTDIERAKSEMNSVMLGLAKDFPASAKNRVYVVKPVVEQIVGDLGPILIIVLLSTGLLLALACVNVTNLLLARGAARAREMAVRVALGAGRGRIVRQLLTESILLATAGTLLGLGIAYAGIRLLLRMSAGTLPRLETVPFDSTVLLFALGAMLVTGLLVGFAPALRLAGTDVKTLMNESGRSASGGKSTARWLNAMTIAEVALAITLVAGAGWLIRGFDTLRKTNPGFVAEKRLIIDANLVGPKFPNPPAVIAAYQDLMDRIRAIGGVEAVGLTSSFPLRGTQENSLFIVPNGEAFNEANPKGSRQRVVSKGLFEAMGVKLVAGRDFDSSDQPPPPPPPGQPGQPNQPPQPNPQTQSAIVNTAFVRRHLEGRDPLTVTFQSGYPNINRNLTINIVGVVDDIRQKSIGEAAEPAYYTPITQAAQRRQTIVVSTKGEDSAAIRGAIREEIRKTDPTMAVDFESVPELVAGTLKRQELGMTLMLLFGVAAVLLAAVGIYGVIAYASAQRRNEVATRLALGATPGTVFWLVLKQGRTLAIIGTAIGLALAYGAGRIVSSQLYAVNASDPTILGGATALVAVIALIATTVPAWRASRIDPSKVLRPE